MKKTLTLTILLLVFSATYGKQPVIIKIKTVKDSVVLNDASKSMKIHHVYTDCYQFDNPKDSVYLNLQHNWFVDGSYMMSKLVCHPAYDFVSSIPDGIYTIIIDNKLKEKIAISNGRRNGFTCIYHKRPHQLTNYSSTQGNDRRLYFILNYIEDQPTEFYALDKKGNVIEYMPVVKDSSDLEFRVVYYFDQKGRLRIVCYGSAFYFYFTKKGKYEKAESYSAEIERKEMTKNSLPDGLVEMQFGGLTKYHSYFKNGTLVKWQVIYNEPARTIGFDVPSDKIGVKKTDILDFIES